MSENLLSLRKFADAGMSIQLDDENLTICDKETKEIIVRGFYRKPNWEIVFSIEDEVNESEIKYKKMSCIADVIDESSNRTDQESHLLECKNSEGVSAQISQKGNRVVNKIEVQEKVNLVFDDSQLKRKITDLNDPAELEVLEDLIRREKEDGTDPENFKLLSEGMLWHSRLGHASLDYLKQLQKLEVKLKNVKSEKDILDCDICKLAKMAKIPLKGKRKRAERPLEIIHTDIMGPINMVSFPGRSRFIITFTDDYSRLIKAYSIKTKDEAGNRLEEFIKSMRNLISSNAKVCFIRSDQAPEYLGGKFNHIL